MIDIELLIIAFDELIASLESRSFHVKKPSRAIYARVNGCFNQSIDINQATQKLSSPKIPQQHPQPTEVQKYDENVQVRKNNSKSHQKSKHHCEICNKSFAKRYSLTRHLYLHTGIRPHQCQFCDYRAIQLSDLNRHIQSIHDNAPKFMCQHCGAKFNTKKSLTNHEILHSNSSPYHCPVVSCRKTFRSSKTLRNHKLAFHTNITYECDICGKISKLKDNMKSHLKNHALGGFMFQPKDYEERILHLQKRAEKIKR